MMSEVPGPGRTTRRWAALLLAAAVALAACTSSPGVSERESNESGSTPPGTEAPSATPQEVTGEGDIDGSIEAPLVEFPSTAVEEPDASGLPDIDAVDPEIERGTLENGLRYFVRENDNPGSRVEMRLAIDAGSALQNDTQGGGAHFLEHMLFNGTEQFPANDLIAVLRSFGAAFGADINAYTSYDETVYELTMPTADPTVVSTGLDVLQQWLSAATLDPAEVEAERGVVLDEWRGSAQSSDGRIFDEIQKFFLDGSPYEGRTPIGEDTEINSTEDGPLREFYDDWYRPDNAAVIVVGDIDARDIVGQIEDRFSSAEARGDSPERVDLVVDPPTEPRARVVSDPDVSEGFAFVTLPVGREAGASSAETVQRDILLGLAFDIIGTRLANDALRGDAPFDDAGVDSSGFVRLLDAPEISVSADGVDMEASIKALLDEYERARRFGFTPSEVQRAVEARRSASQSDFEGRFSRQDSSYADEYVRHVLEGEAVPTASRWFDFVTEVLDRATPETIAYMFVDRVEHAAPHIFVAVPADELADVPAEGVFVRQALDVIHDDLAPRPDDAAIGDRLMDPPAPIDEIAEESLADGSDIGFIAPTVLTFANGVRVALNTTPITDGGVLVEGRSPGGLAAVADADVPAAEAAGAVVGRSGVAQFDPVALDAFLSDKEIQLDVGIDVFTEELAGYTATSDLETMFQLIHLGMTQPRVDPIALEQYIDDQLPFAEDPSIEPNYAEFKQISEARYDDRRYLLPSTEDLDGLDAADIERVFRDRFGDASDWVFSFSGDFDLDEARDLARTYLATLPATGRDEPTDYVEPDPPAGAIVETTQAGEGDQARVSFLFTAPASNDRRDDIAARIVQEVITARLTDTIREELGESYSPFSILELTDGASPNAELYLSISTGPELVESVSSAVLEQLADLRTNGPTETEYSAAAETIGNELELFSNEQINDEVLRVLTDPAGNASFDDFLTQDGLVGTISRTDVRIFVERWAPADRFIEVRVVPR